MNVRQFLWWLSLCLLVLGASLPLAGHFRLRASAALRRVAATLLNKRMAIAISSLSGGCSAVVMIWRASLPEGTLRLTLFGGVTTWDIVILGASPAFCWGTAALLLRRASRAEARPSAASDSDHSLAHSWRPTLSVVASAAAAVGLGLAVREALLLAPLLPRLLAAMSGILLMLILLAFFLLELSKWIRQVLARQTAVLVASAALTISAAILRYLL